MLQIISGKFFSGGKLNEQESDAILYSNYSWIAPLKTSVAELRPVDTYGSRVASYVLRYTNRHEQAPGDILYLAHADEAVEQFRLLASLYFQSFFHVDRSYVEKLCRSKASHSFDRTVPAAFVPRFFDFGKQGTQPESAGLVPFIEKVIAMPRKQYRLLMTCLAGFFESLEAIGDNFDLAYSMMVYMLEALSKSIEQPPPVWEDYDQNIRAKLDKELAAIEPSAADAVRAILLNNPHLKLKKRFVTFIASYLNDAFFTSEAEEVKFPLAKSEVARALGNLYDARSGYVHELKQVQEQLRLQVIATTGEVFDWMNDVHLTFAGLARVGRHVLMSFIERQPSMDREEYAWRDEMPGVVTLALAPQYWAWRTDGFQPPQARQRFNALVEHVLTERKLLDLRKLMEVIEEQAPKAKPTDRLPMLSLYWMFNGMAPPEDRRPGWEDFLRRWESELDQCSIEVMTLRVLWGQGLEWPVDACAEAFAQYERSRHKATATNLPRLLEVSLMAEIANRFLDDGRTDDYDAWAVRAILDAAGHKQTQDYLGECRAKSAKIHTRQILFPTASTPSGDAKSDSTLVTDNDIRRRAYFKWESAGRPADDAVRFWLEAEHELRKS